MKNYLQLIKENCRISIGVILIFSLLISSCTMPSLTKALWENSTRNDVIKSVLISKETNKIVFLGKKYHYIFDDSSKILDRLFLNKKDFELKVSYSNFKINLKNEVTTELNIFTNKKLTAKQLSFLKELGFKKSREYIEKTIKLNGNIYLPDPKVNYDIVSSKLSKDYNITLEYEKGFFRKSTAVVLTPVTVVVDVAMPFLAIGLAVAGIVALASLVPLLIPFAIAENGNNRKQVKDQKNYLSRGNISY